MSFYVHIAEQETGRGWRRRSQALRGGPVGARCRRAPAKEKLAPPLFLYTCQEIVNALQQTADTPRTAGTRFL